MTRFFLRFRISPPTLVIGFCLVLIGIVWRLPLYRNAEFLLSSDEAVNQLTIQHLFRFRELYYFYHGMRYQGLTEALFSLPFVPFFGFSALSVKLAGTAIYICFVVLALRFLFQRIKDPWTRWGLIILSIFPSAHLYHLSFIASGGHFLNALIGFTLILTVYKFHKEKRTSDWYFPVLICSIVALGVYTYQHFLIFYPLLALMIHTFRGGLPRFSYIHFRNLGTIATFSFSFPILNQIIGETLQSQTYETLNSFTEFKTITLNHWDQILEKTGILFFNLWPTLLITRIQDHFYLSGVVVGVLVLSAMVWLFFSYLKDQSDHWKLYRIGAIHILVVMGSILLTPYSFLPSEVRYLCPVYSVVPIMIAAIISEFEIKKRNGKMIWMGRALFAALVIVNCTNTILFNRFLGIQEFLAPSTRSQAYSEVVGYLEGEGVICVFMDYNDAYRITLLTQEKIKASSVYLPRIKRYEDCAIRQNPRVVVFPKDHELIQTFLNFRLKNAVQYRLKKNLENFTVLEAIAL